MNAIDEQAAVLNDPVIRHPCGSRESNRVAFYWNPLRRRGLYFHDIDTGVTKKVTDQGLRIRSFPEDFLWGRNGQRLFYIRPRGRGDFDGPFDLLQTNIDTDMDATTIFSDTNFFVLEDMHPEQDELLFSYRRGSSQLYRLTLSSGDLERVGDHLLVRKAHYSPDGQWIAINSAYSEDSPDEQLHVTIATESGKVHKEHLTSDPVEFISWHPSTSQILVKAADDQSRFGFYEVTTDTLQWIDTNNPECEPVDFLPSGKGILALCDGTLRIYPIEKETIPSDVYSMDTSPVVSATVTDRSIVVHQHDANGNSILVQSSGDTSEWTTVLTSKPAPGATYRTLITDVAKQLARTPRIEDDNRMAVGTVHSAERKVLTPLLDEGFEIIGTGLGRLVLRFPQSSAVSDYVVKLARFGDTPLYSGAIQNQWEVTVWEENIDENNIKLLPIQNFQNLSYRWLIMPYGEPITDYSLHEQLMLVEELQTELADLEYLNTFDIHRNNIVRYQDTYYLADYGRPLMD